jgi:hypothetical protein
MELACRTELSRDALHEHRPAIVRSKRSTHAVTLATVDNSDDYAPRCQSNRQTLRQSLQCRPVWRGKPGRPTNDKEERDGSKEAYWSARGNSDDAVNRITRPPAGRRRWRLGLSSRLRARGVRVHRPAGRAPQARATRRSPQNDHRQRERSSLRRHHAEGPLDLRQTEICRHLARTLAQAQLNRRRDHQDSSGRQHSRAERPHTKGGSRTPRTVQGAAAGITPDRDALQVSDRCPSRSCRAQSVFHEARRSGAALTKLMSSMIRCCVATPMSRAARPTRLGSRNACVPDHRRANATTRSATL